MKLFKAGKYTGKEMLNLPEIAYRLSLFGFTITYFLSISEEINKTFLENPLKYLHQMVAPQYHHFIDDT
jgi:YHS domain-containing protein